MRWFARRLVFYVFAIWVALTINFLLPRLMPGDPIAGLLAHLNPSQLAANPGLIQTYQALLGGGDNSIWQDYVTYLGRVVHFDFGLSTSNYPTPVSEVIGRTLPYSIFLVGVAFLLSFVLGTAIGMIAAWRRGGVVDNVFVPTFMTIGAFPGLLHRAARPLLPRPEGGLVPDPARVRHRPDARASTGRFSRARSATRSCRSSSSSSPTPAAGC